MYSKSFPHGASPPEPEDRGLVFEGAIVVVATLLSGLIMGGLLVGLVWLAGLGVCP